MTFAAAPGADDDPRGRASMNAALQQLAHVTALVGRDPLLTQGAGGNTSLKIGDRLWVKASGAWMRDAEDREIFAQASAGEFTAALRSGAPGSVEAVAQAGAASGALRPSIEAVLHAIMPQSAVIHAHAINSVVCSVLADWKDRFRAAAQRLGVRARCAPYLKPGAVLAAAIAKDNAAHGAPDVILLQNHGLLVGAPTPAAALDLLLAVERALAFPVRALSAQEGAEAPPEGFELDSDHAGVACDPELCAAITQAPLTPDQVVFVGGAPCAAPRAASVARIVQRAAAATGIAPALAYVPGLGALRRRGLTEGQRAQCVALFEVARRAPVGARIVGLTQDQASELVNWDAEKFRRAADESRV
ncbi:MAG: class II aldolase [Hyphomonadaceae bacterium]|nr:class II aldolase [Hyphomonadaceae bacterium]